MKKILRGKKVRKNPEPPQHGIPGLNFPVKVNFYSNPNETESHTNEVIQMQDQQMEETKLRVQEEYIARERENREDIQAHELEKIIVKEQENRKTQLEKAAIEVYKFAQDKDEDANGIPDHLESLKAMQQITESNRKLELQERQLNLKEKEMEQKKELEEKKMKVQAKKAQK